MIALFAGVFGLLAIGYFAFLRPGYEPVFAQVRPPEAAAIVAQLDAKSIPYRLADGGATILVPADQANAARLAIAGSDVGLRGGVGFELFNKSDMGLTDFAQRINYQRALQGELERSIMLLGDVEAARVHLAIPERTIFRSERTNAKAAVELIAKAGTRFDEGRVAGVQRLVAFAVPQLSAGDVVVLDGSGHVLSAVGEDPAFLSTDAEEKRGIQGYYRARARAALDQTLPGVQAEVRVLSLGAILPTAPAAAPSGNATATPTTAAAPRNFRLRVIVATAAPLNEEDAARARDAVLRALALDEPAGDELSFQTGLAPRAAVPAVMPAADGTATPAAAMATTPVPSPYSWTYWLLGAIAAGVAAVMALAFVRGGRDRLSVAEREAMIARIRAALRETEGAHAGA